MKKYIVIPLLLILIITSFSFAILYYFLNINSPDNTINNSFRKKIIASFFLRRIFRLNQVGDARYDFTSNEKFKRININVYYQYGEVLYPQTIEKAAFKIQEITKKPKGITIKKIPITTFIQDHVTDQEINLLTKKYPAKWITTDDTVTLQIFILKKYNEFPTYAGIVKDAHNIFIFKDSISDVSDRQATTQDAEISTILHEFAHLLGADHVGNPTCILHEKVENLTDNLPTDINTSYCQEDLEAIQDSL